MSHEQSGQTPGLGRALVDGAGWPFVTLTFGLPLVATVVALVVEDLSVINLVHVTSGALWAGATVFLGVVVGPTVAGLDPQTRGEVNTPMIPKNLFLFAGVAIATLVTGPVMAMRLDILVLDDPLIVAALLIAAGLLVGAVYLVWAQASVYAEMGTPGPPDTDRVAALGARIAQLSPVMVLLQLGILVNMALLATS